MGSINRKATDPSAPEELKYPGLPLLPAGELRRLGLN